MPAFASVRRLTSSWRHAGKLMVACNCEKTRQRLTDAEQPSLFIHAAWWLLSSFKPLRASSAEAAAWGKLSAPLQEEILAQVQQMPWFTLLELAVWPLRRAL